MSPLLLGAALGATSAYMLDPATGGRRRAFVRDKFNESREFASATAEDLRRHRVRGLAAAAGAASIVYALARGGFGALVPLALGAALFARSIKASGSSRRSAQKA